MIKIIYWLGDERHCETYDTDSIVDAETAFYFLHEGVAIESCEVV